MKEEIDKKINIRIYFDNLDLILKIIGIIIFNNLTPILVKNFFEFLDSLYQVISENKYEINEIESNIIISLLIDKLSLNNKFLRDNLLSLLNKYIEYMDANKIMVTVINITLNKNNKIKSDILDLIIDLVNQDKLNISTKVYTKLLCEFLPIYENGIRNKTLPLFKNIYSHLGDELWNMIDISLRDKKFLEENIYKDEEENEEREDEEEEDDKDGKNKIKNQREFGVDKNENDKNQNIIENNKDNKKENKGIDKLKALEGKNGSLTKEDIDTIFDGLLADNPNKKLNSIVLIQEHICDKFYRNKEILIPNIDNIIAILIIVSHKLFEVKDLNTIQINLAKNLTKALWKLASNKELISHLSYNVLVDIIREILSYLSIDDLDKIGGKQEGNMIFKYINNTILIILENCNITFVITAFLELIKEFQEKDDKKFINLAIEYLLKAKHNLTDENIDSVDLSKILLQIHLLLLSLQNNNKDLNRKSDTDDNIINAVKNILKDFLKLKKEKILEEYLKLDKNYQFQDKFLLKLIKDALEN